MLMDGHRMLRLYEAAPLLGMSTLTLRRHLSCPGHGLTVHERQGQSCTLRYLRADEVARAAGGLDAELLGQAAEAAKRGKGTRD